VKNSNGNLTDQSYPIIKKLEKTTERILVHEKNGRDITQIILNYINFMQCYYPLSPSILLIWGSMVLVLICPHYSYHHRAYRWLFPPNARLFYDCKPLLFQYDYYLLPLIQSVIIYYWQEDLNRNRLENSKSMCIHSILFTFCIIPINQDRFLYCKIQAS
jgi:hypothetical protein